MSPHRPPTGIRYVVDGQHVSVARQAATLPAIFDITANGVPLRGTVQKTALGRFRVIDANEAVLGSVLGLRAAVEQVVRAERAAALALPEATSSHAVT